MPADKIIASLIYFSNDKVAKWCLFFGRSDLSRTFWPTGKVIGLHWSFRFTPIMSFDLVVPRGLREELGVSDELVL